MSDASRPLRVVKFGGTSLGDAACIRRAVQIIRDAAAESDLVVVVSAMSGVTNKLVEAAMRAEEGDSQAVEAIFRELRERHRIAIAELIHSLPARRRISEDLEKVFEEGDYYCQRTELLRELSPPARDFISSLGERFSAPLIAGVLAENGLSSQAIEGVNVIVTDSCHGAAEPLMAATRERCETRLRPLLRQRVIPVLTGFIGATEEGVLTTLGRGGSDYSATILGAGLDADEVTIWTDVDGLMTADPRLVPEATTIAEISYQEAAALAHFGAKVLHPKTISAVTSCGIPLQIRNTFSPESPGTRITPAGPPTDRTVKGLAAISNVTLITVGGAGTDEMPEVLGRAFAATTRVRVDVLLISQFSSQDRVSLVVFSSVAEITAQALRCEFAQDLANEKVKQITLDSTLSVITLVGKNMRGSVTVSRTLAAAGCENVSVIAIAQGSSDCSVSFIVSERDVKTILNAIHREFNLAVLKSPPIPVSAVVANPAMWQFVLGQRTATAD